MKKAGVIGDPIGHSLSPAIFSFLSKIEEKNDFSYDAFLVTPNELSPFFENAKNDFIGLNVTIPHKEVIMSFLSQVNPAAQAVGAVNVVRFLKSKSEGYNTDVEGFAECLIENKITLKGKSALIIGAGGAAKAVAYALGKGECAKVTILNKTLPRAKKIVESMTPLFPATSFDAFSHVGEIKTKQDFNLIVNSTPIGMEGILFTEQNLEFFQEILTAFSSEKTVMVDLIYRPEETPFLKLAKAQGSFAIGGMSMLINQALATWEIWMGPLKNKQRAKEDLSSFLRRVMMIAKNNRIIFLTGFMAVGKSTVGKILARALGWRFVDTDTLIEQKTRQSIPEIFSSSGESEFRKLESQVIEELSSIQNTVVALGGGALMNEATLELIKKSGSLIYLSASLENLLERLKETGESRPLLKVSGQNSAGANSAGQNLANQNSDDNLASTVTQMMKVREGQYRKAHLIVETNRLAPSQVAEKIMSALSEEKGA